MCLRFQGLQPDRTVLSLEFPIMGEQATALTQGQVDAVTTWEPSITKIQSSGDTQILADGTDLFKGENTIVADLQKTADFLYESGTISQQLQIKDSVVKP